MFPTVSHFLEYLFGIHLPLPFKTFGLFVALAFIAGYWAFSKELKRKEALGILHSFKKKVMVGVPASTTDLITNGLFGFVIGYKLVYVVLNYQLAADHIESVLMSLQGNILGGLFFAGLFAYWDYKEKAKVQLAKPKEVEITVHPYQLMSTIVVWAAICGFLGAKIFDGLEYWDDFVQHPIDRIFSNGGFTFYGGLICGGAAVLYVARKNGIKPLHMLDVGGPGMMLAYAVGRIGCHMAGDGDWGIPNPYPKPFSGLPDWLWSYRYPHNVVEEGIPMANCTGKFCNELAQGVYPTPLYEVIVCLILFAFLWSIRDQIKAPGLMFGIYMILNGLERFCIELIRVNSKYTVLGVPFTQAEMISTFLVIGGIILSIYALRNKNTLA